MQLMSSQALGGIRSLVCDRNGIVIAETVYRCMICSDVFAELEEIHMHYQLEHIEKEILPQSNQNVAPKHPLVEVDFENDDFELSPLPTVNNNSNNFSVASSYLDKGNNGEVEGNRNTCNNKNGTSKGGYVTCEICSLTKYYSHISRRCGIFSCEACFKQFSRFLQKPVKYTCARNNQCPLNIDLPGARCKSCLLDACFNKFKLDPKKHPKLFCKESAFFPVPNSGQVALNAEAVQNVSSGSAESSMLKVVSKPKAKSNKVRKEPIVPRRKGSRSLLSTTGGPLSPVNSEEAGGERSSTMESKLMLPSLPQAFLPSAKKRKRKNNELPLLHGAGATNQQRSSPSRQ